MGLYDAYAAHHWRQANDARFETAAQSGAERRLIRSHDWFGIGC
jgi:hypothetical protein